MELDQRDKLKWTRGAERVEVQYGTSRAGAVQVPLCRTADDGPG
ncbi:hypothetical protein ACWDNT_12395 [Streptomyces sp. NPDC000963]